MKDYLRTVSLLFICLLAGCTAGEETMTLLEEPIKEVKISKHAGYGGINEDFFRSVQSEQELAVIREVIETSVESTAEEMNASPDFDMAVIYQAEQGEYPSHGIHMWLDEPVKFMYIADDTIYTANPVLSEKLHDILK